MTKEAIKAREKKLLELTGEFCSQKLDDDYLQLCKKLVLKMGRKREVPFKSGKIEIWAAAVIYAIGYINFLSDKSSEPYATADQICEYFGTKKSTVSAKAKQIRDMFKMGHYNFEFSTQRMMKDNPFNDLVMVNGFMVPLSSIPVPLQALVKKERAKGRDMKLRFK